MIGCDSDNQDKKSTFEFEPIDLSLIYTFEDNSKLYSELGDIDVFLSDGSFKLSDAISKNMIGLDEVIDRMNYVSEVNDGGSILYEYKVSDNGLFNVNLMLVKCHKIIDGSNDYNRM